MIFYVSGAYVPQEEARVSVLDRGFLLGDSVYETVRAHAGRILFWKDHLARLRRSAAMLGIEIAWDRIDLLAILRELLRLNERARARIRIIVTRGTGNPHRLAGFTPTWVVTMEDFEPPPGELYESGVAVVVVSVARLGAASLNPEIKSSNLLNNVLARREALEKGAFEGVLLNPRGLVAEAAHSNIFWVTPEGALRTPARSVGLLPGITRQKILAIAQGMGLPVSEAEAPPEELNDAREIFLTSTSWEALAVTRWNGRIVGDGRAGPRARDLRARLRDLYDLPEEAA